MVNFLSQLLSDTKWSSAVLIIAPTTSWLCYQFIGVSGNGRTHPRLRVAQDMEVWW
jgi:hypothetical protein